MSAQGQDLERWAHGELMSADPKRRSMAAQRLVFSLDLALSHASEMDKKESQLKHTYGDEASAPKAMSATGFMAYFTRASDSAQVSLLRALRDLKINPLVRLERSVGLLTWALSAPAPKVRQRCAQLLSAHPILSLSHLREALWAEEVYFVRSSIILAIGRLSDPEARSALALWAQRPLTSDQELGAQERSALLKATSALSHLHPDASPTLSFHSPVGQALIWCAPLGLERSLCAELSQAGWRNATPLSDAHGHSLERAGLVLALPPTQLEDVTITAQAPLPRPRCSEGLTLMLSTRPSRGDEPRAHRLSELLHLAERALADRPELMNQAKMLTAPFQYRIDLSVKSREAHRALLSRSRALMTSLFPHGVESPSDYQAQLIARFGDQDTLILRLDALSTRPEPNRVADVGASMAQPVASAVARHSQMTRAQLGLVEGEGHVILDPTCGSGTLLLERALLECELEQDVSAQFYGHDLSRVAHSSCLENLGALSLHDPELGRRVRFQRLDSAQATWPWFDEALMNLPFGLRVTGASGQRATQGELNELYFALFQRAAERAKPRATLTAYSARRALLERASREAGWRVMSAQSLWSGGLLVHLVSYRRP